jgi:thymidylate synthase (FAD)
MNKDNVVLIGSYGNDHTVCESARMSFNSKKKFTELDDRLLIERMIKNGHTSPFEQVNFTFKLRMPIFVARQWMRHRTAKINEQSGRYTQLKCEFYKPSRVEWRTTDEIRVDRETVDKVEKFYQEAENLYKELISKRIVKEQARIVLPLATYTEFIWQMDLHNLMHFLELRMSFAAQEEIREYAREVYLKVKEICPITMELLYQKIMNKEQRI